MYTRKCPSGASANVFLLMVLYRTFTNKSREVAACFAKISTGIAQNMHAGICIKRLPNGPAPTHACQGVI